MHTALHYYQYLFLLSLLFSSCTTTHAFLTSSSSSLSFKQQSSVILPLHQHLNDDDDDDDNNRNMNKQQTYQEDNALIRIKDNMINDDDHHHHHHHHLDTTFRHDNRRSLIQRILGSIVVSAATAGFCNIDIASADTVTDLNNDRQYIQQYDDFIETSDGISYRDVNIGTGSTIAAQMGNRVVYDWSGYTIGYFGRPFQAKGGPQGGAFDKDIDYYRTILGSHEIISGLELGIVGMKVGGIRQIIIPYTNDLSYSDSTDLEHVIIGPKPSTFSGQRALNFVIQNPRLDRTLLFNIKLIRIDIKNISTNQYQRS